MSQETPSAKSTNEATTNQSKEDTSQTSETEQTERSEAKVSDSQPHTKEAELLAKFQQLEQACGAHKNEHLRALADIENLKKRHAREKEEALKYGTHKLLKDILPVADNLARALQASPNKEDDPRYAALFQGVQMVQKELLNFLQSQGVTEVKSKGETFDPQKHEAIKEVPSNEHAPGNIVDVIQEGYEVHDRLLRPALVTVSQAPEKETTQVKN